MINQVEYYRTPAVRQKIAEYCGGDASDPTSFSAEYLVGFGEALVWERHAEPFISTGKDGFEYILGKGLDFFRSNWDRLATLGIVDIEYFNHDYPGEIYLNPGRCFELLEPSRQAVRKTLERFGIPFIEIMTGQGYHFSTRVTRGSETDAQLIEIGRVNDSVAGKYLNPSGRRSRYVSLQHGRSFDGMGRLMDYISHQVLMTARPQSEIPIVTTDVLVRKGRTGREAISVDLSMYGDPIYMRDIRVPFSTHQKHKVARDKVGSHIANKIPVQTCIPTGSIPLNERLRMRRHFKWTSEWSETCGSMEIPVADAGYADLMAEYRKSRLFEFHNHFDSAEHDPWTEWPRTYDRLDLRSVPAGIAWALRNPNPALLQPNHLRQLTRTLLDMGWHPRHIAGLVRSKYERNHGWEGGWAKYDAAMRADFYVRLFAGQIWNGLD